MRFPCTLKIVCLAFLFGFAPLLHAAALFDPEAQPVGYVGQIAVTNADVTSGTEFVFSIDYSPDGWRGNLHKYSISAAGEIAEQDEWLGGAAAIIDAQDFDTDRRIVTMQNGHGIPFRWQHLSAQQQATLDPDTAAQQTGHVSSSSSPLLNFIRGERANEFPASLQFRERASVLGDILHASPVFCASQFCKADTVFVGANDGMLHAIDAETGKERFAYIPAFLLPKLNALAQRPYQHRYFIDGHLVLKRIGSRTILIGTTAAGGKGVFALDVSDASPGSEAAAAARILWEISPETPGFENLGYTYAQPVITTLSNGETTLVLPNGYNNTSNGHAILYLIEPLTGKKLQEIDTHAFGGSGNADNPNGLSSVSVWSSASGNKMDTAFAGDLDGAMWQFDLLKATATRIHATQPSQGITSAPALTRHPYGGAIVMFVTGRLLAPEDAEDRSPHYAYGIWNSAPPENADLLTQTLSEVTYASQHSRARVRIATDHLPDWRRYHHKGWRTALPTGGERLLGDGTFVSRRLFQFISTNPSINTGAQPGDTPPYGENWWMQLNALTGGSSYVVAFDLNHDGYFNTADLLSHARKLYFPVGLYLGGGTRSQMLPLRTRTGAAFHASFDSHFFLTPLAPPAPMDSTSSVTIRPKGASGTPNAPDSIAPGGAVRDGKPDKRGEPISAERLGRVNWMEIQQ